MIELLRKRRSIRRYTNAPIETEKLEILKEAVLRSPSSKDINPWEFIFVDDKKIISQLKHCKPESASALETAQLAIVICADETKNDVWIEDCSIASIIFQLTAQSLGLGSCWIQVRNRNYNETVSSERYIQKLLGIPSQYKILNIIAMGYAQSKRDGKPAGKLQFDKIKINRFQ